MPTTFLDSRFRGNDRLRAAFALILSTHPSESSQHSQPGTERRGNLRSWTSHAPRARRFAPAPPQTPSLLGRKKEGFRGSCGCEVPERSAAPSHAGPILGGNANGSFPAASATGCGLCRDEPRDHQRQVLDVFLVDELVLAVNAAIGADGTQPEELGFPFQGDDGAEVTRSHLPVLPRVAGHLFEDVGQLSRSQGRAEAARCRCG